jgi:hypothetical protein
LTLLLGSVKPWFLRVVVVRRVAISLWLTSGREMRAGAAR